MIILILCHPNFSSIFVNECQFMLEEYKHLYDEFIYIINGDCRDKLKIRRNL